MPELTMPRLSDTMQEGTLARWLKKPGEAVQKGDVVAEIETDKATMDLEAYDSGVLQKILVQEGQTVPIGQPIAVIGTGEAEETTRGQAETGVEAGPEAKPAVAPPAEAAPALAQPAAPEPRAVETAEGRNGRAEVKASPMARAVARDLGVDLQTVQGSGPGGRVIRADVEAAVERGGQAPAPAERVEKPAPPLPSPPLAAEDVEEIPLTSMRKVVARRMLESVQTTPHFYLTSVVDAEALVAFRAQLNERLGKSGNGMKVSLNDLLVKACANVLRANPDVNVSFGGDKLLRHKRVNVGVAVALEGGLIVPVIRDADQKSLAQVAREAKSLIERAHAGTLTPADYTGGTFTISNLGMFGVDHFTAIINPPESAILAVGATTPEPVARDGQVVVRQTIKLTLSIDHRALDGATAARFLQQLKATLEDPLLIIV